MDRARRWGVAASDTPCTKSAEVARIKPLRARAGVLAMHRTTLTPPLALIAAAIVVVSPAAAKAYQSRSDQDT
jgi:hypothetical protein